MQRLACNKTKPNNRKLAKCKTAKRSNQLSFIDGEKLFIQWWKHKRGKSSWAVTENGWAIIENGYNEKLD